MSTICWCPSSGSAAVSPTPDATTWNGHVNSVSRPLLFTRSGTALTTLAYNPDGADHLVDLNSMVAQFVSQILPAQVIPAQQVSWGARYLEAAASNNLFPMLRLYCVNEDGTTNLGNILAGTRQATELGTGLTAAAYVQAGSAVTLTQNWRLVAEWGAGGLPVNTATDTHNMSIAFGDPNASGSENFPQNGDTTACASIIVFANDIITGITPPMTMGVLSAPVGKGW